MPPRLWGNLTTAVVAARIAFRGHRRLTTADMVSPTGAGTRADTHGPSLSQTHRPCNTTARAIDAGSDLNLQPTLSLTDVEAALNELAPEHHVRLVIEIQPRQSTRLLTGLRPSPTSRVAV